MSKGSIASRRAVSICSAVSSGLATSLVVVTGVLLDLRVVLLMNLPFGRLVFLSKNCLEASNAPNRFMVVRQFDHSQKNRNLKR
jgi:hypothetical protein